MITTPVRTELVEVPAKGFDRSVLRGVDGLNPNGLSVNTAYRLGMGCSQAPGCAAAAAPWRMKAWSEPKTNQFTPAAA